MKKILFILAAIAVFVPALGHAKPVAIAAEGSGCLSENASVNINLNSIETDINTVKSRFDDKIADIEKIAKDTGAEQFVMQSLNYNITQQNYNNPEQIYNFSGNANFKIQPGSKAIDVMAALNRKGYHAGVNVNSYNSGNCNIVVPSK